MNEVDVQTGEVLMVESPGCLVANAIGSCIVVGAYSPIEKIGAMAHILVAGQAPSGHAKPFRFSINAIREIVRLMRGAGVEFYVVCLAGGANVLKKADDTICPDNIASVMTHLLRRPEARIVGVDLGGYQRRCVRFECETGSFFTAIEESPFRLLWRAL